MIWRFLPQSLLLGCLRLLFSMQTPSFPRSCPRLLEMPKSWREMAVWEPSSSSIFGEGSQYKSVKHRVDALDIENLTHSYSIVEGDALMGVLESITYHIKIVPAEDGGCI
ncbi:hypothetical protein Pfo_016463 [Paulownia fortunei]|nr:hypothetical protein Pfo_016463 [Paulownia fortunei]